MQIEHSTVVVRGNHVSPPHFLLIKNAILTAFNEEHHNIVDSRILIGHNISVSRILIGLGDKGSYI